MLDVTTTGKVLIIGGLIATFLGSPSAYIDTYILVGFFGVLWVSHMALAGPQRPRIKLTHTLPRCVGCRENIPFTVSIYNSQKTSRDVIVHSATLEDFIEITPKEHIIEWLAANTQVNVHFYAMFSKRGVYSLKGFRTDTLFPFGFLRLGFGRRGKMTILVYPWFFPLTELNIPTGLRYQPGGVALASKIGESTEFIGSRDYQDGDRLRDIDWQAWARTNKPIVREYQEEYFCRIALVVDTYFAKNSSNDEENFESGLSICAAIADYLSRQEYIIDIFAAGPKVCLLEAGRALAHLDQILEVLACLQPCYEHPFDQVEPAIVERISRLTTIILVFLDLDQERLEFIERIRGLGVGLKVIICNDGKINQANLIEAHDVSMQVVRPVDVQKGIESL